MAAEASPPSALGHLRVLDLTRPDSHYCGKLLADLGADVVKVEPPEGDVARSMAPFAGGTPHPEASLYFINFNANKRSLTLDLSAKAGRSTFRRLAATADVVLESFAPGYLDELGLGFRRLSRVNPALVMTSITPFGQWGPYSKYLGSEQVAQAMGGLMYVQGDDKKAPCAAPCGQATQLACLHAAYGTLAALRYCAATGRGQRVDISMQEVVAHLNFTVSRYAFDSNIIRRPGVASTIAPNGYYRCRDGYVCLSVFTDDHWKELVQWMGVEALTGPAWESLDFRRSQPDVIDQFVAEFASRFTVGELVKDGQSRHLAVTPMNTVADLVASPQLRSRNYFLKSHHPHIGEHLCAGGPYRLSRTPWQLRRPAPLLGQHQKEIIQQLEDSRAAKADRRDTRRNTDRSHLPLEGVRIADFSRVWAGPLATRYLGDFGAEIIKIETNDFLDTWRISSDAGYVFPEVNRNKQGVTVNFRQPQGLELVKELVAVSDVVVENFAAGVMERRGLGYESLRLVKPDIITVGMPGYGNSGPYAGYVAYGQSLMSYSGLALLWGHPDSPYEAHPKVHYPDFISAAAAATAIMAALEYRSRTGQGQSIEIAQAETALSTMGVAILDYLVNGQEWQPAGNRDVNAAPHGCYSCLGDDQWCVISCRTEEQWRSLCGVIGKPSLGQDPRFVSMASRREYYAELDEYIGAWTTQYTPNQAMRLLQRAGVPAGVVQSGEQLYYDYHLRARNFLVEQEQPGRGKVEGTGLLVGLSRSPGRIAGGVPELGEHNSQVFCGLLGLSTEDFGHLAEAGVIR